MHAADCRLAGFDDVLARALAAEARRQEDYIELIASENYVSPRVLEALGSTLTNKYADGYPGRRAYSGCEHVDVAEALAIDRAKRLFGAGYANVQPYSGSQANAAALAALLEPGDTLLGMSAGHGGHVTHGDPASFSGRYYDAVHYGVAADGAIDYAAVAALAERHRPKLIVAGFSAHSGIVDWRRFREIADGCGAKLLADIAHVAGLVAAGLYPSPIGIADVVTTTTHKTLRGPRGGMILAGSDPELAARLDRAVYPGTQGGPLMHVVAAKAVAFEEALQPDFRDYQRRVLANAKAMARALAARGHAIVGGGTDNHMLMIDLRSGGVDARAAERRLEDARIAVNAIGLPSLPGSAGSGGLRLGTPAITTRGLGEAESEALAGFVADVLDAPLAGAPADAARDRIRGAVAELTRAFPVYARPAC